MSRCVICCADEMIVGRWYKLVTYPVGVADISDGVPAIVKYWVKYSCDSEKVCLLHDTIFIKKTGEFTVSCIDKYGHTDSKTITAIEEPTIERTVHEIMPTSFEDLKEKINSIGENAYINIVKGEYTFDIPNTYYDLPRGVVLDFNNSIINVTTQVADTEPYLGFRLNNSYNGIKNATFKGIDIGEGSSYKERTTDLIYEKCVLIWIRAGDYHKIENLVFDDVAGFNLTLGAWPAFWTHKPSGTASRWRESNNYNGYIANDGSIVASSDSWTMTDYVESIIADDRSYCVGNSGMWIPTSVRMYDIAFYDSDGNFLELKKDQQYFKKYYYPENTKYVRYCVHQMNEPEEKTARDDYCVMRMMGGTADMNRCPTVKECMIDNVVHLNNASGGFSGVGLSEHVHINRMRAIGSGWLNGWAFDLEDGWNSMMDYTISHSYFGTGLICLHGAQGVTLISTILGRLTLANNVHFPTIINCLLESPTLNGVRGNITAINSYWGTIIDTEGYGNSYAFGMIDKDTATNMRYRMVVAFS